jgi:hypothetical protein
MWPIWPVSSSCGWKVSSVLIGWVPSLQCLLLAHSCEQERWENPAIPLHNGSAMQNCLVIHPPPPSLAIAALFSRYRTNYFKLFISLLCVTYSICIRKITWKLYYYLNLCQIKKLDQLILDTGPGVLSNIWPIWLVHMFSQAGQEYG